MYSQMKDFVALWRAYLQDKYGETSDLTSLTDAGVSSEEAQDVLKLQRFVQYQVPYVFDRNIAGSTGGVLDQNSVPFYKSHKT